MKLAILSDIHGNLEAFQAVIHDCQEIGIDQMYCAGDIVGYGANPKECIELIQKYNMPTVAGNHDWAVCKKIDIKDFNDEAKTAVEWTQKQLKRNQLSFLKRLELTHTDDYIMMAHGTLNQPEQFHYLHDINDALDSFYMMNHNVCFVGHTHLPQILVKQDDAVAYAPNTYANINPDFRYIVNVGSVGQPRDDNPKACYCFLDLKLNRLELKRVSYDITGAQNKIIAAGLPQFLAQRLSMGQ